MFSNDENWRDKPFSWTMKKLPTLHRDGLRDFAETCFYLLTQAPGKNAALKNIAETCTRRFGEYFGPEILADPDELSVNFIELLDQTVFEMIDNPARETTIRDYIIEDLYHRLSLYLDMYRGLEYYERSLLNRKITLDDLVIIRYYRLDHYTGELMDDFYEQPTMQRSILKTLLVFNDERLLNFYYQIIRELHSLEVKGLALMGLKQCHNRFSNWHSLKNIDDDLTDLVNYIEAFETEDVSKNPVPGNITRLNFALTYIEMNQQSLMKRGIVPWVFSVMRSVLYLNADSSLFTTIYNSIATIIVFFDTEYIRFLLKDERHLISFVCLMDILPGPVFDRIRMKLDLLGKDFINSINELRFSGKIRLDELNSNVMGYLYRGSLLPI